MSGETPCGAGLVRQYRHILLWPLQLRVEAELKAHCEPWRLLTESCRDIWQPVEDEFTLDPDEFQERHYKEFVAFLPYVQRFLYGEMRCARTKRDAGHGASPMHIMRRRDVAALRVWLTPDTQPFQLTVVHADLYFFHDMDVVLLNVELSAEDVPLPLAQQMLYRFGRAYPSGWHASGQGLHNTWRSEWLGANGNVLMSSDSSQRERFLRFVAEHRAPAISSHWAFLLQPLVQDAAPDEGQLRFRQIEYHRMPLLAYLALDNPRALAADDFVRLGLITSLRPGDALPRRDPAIAEFEQRYCDDRYWTDTDEGPNTRFICTGGALIVVGDAGSRFFCDVNKGLLSQFRHQYFLLFLIAHFHRAVLLHFSGLLVEAISALEVSDNDSVRRFKRRIRSHFESFLRFSHRYWFHELSERGQVQSLFRRCSEQLGNDRLFAKIKDDIGEMSRYLDSDSQRRQSNTVVRLTVVTICGLVATIVTGYFGMNVLDFGQAPLIHRVFYLIAVTGIALMLTVFAIAKSKRLSDFIEAIADERMSTADRIKALREVVRRRRPDDDI